MRKKRIFAVVAIVLVLFGCVGCACNGNEPALDDRRPMVYVNDTLYGDTGKVLVELPGNAKLLGTLTKCVSQKETPKENFSSNLSPSGSEVYIDDKTPERIYIKIVSPDRETKYSIYEIIQA